TELADTINSIPYAPENEGYAGAENPKGIRFEGIVRWVKPIYGSDDKIAGYVTFALNHDHLLDMIAHITPMNERYSELSSAHDGNYAFIWDYNCRSIVHPRHYSIYGFNPETGKPETSWLEQSLYEGMINAGYKREDWQEYIATLKDYTPWTGDKESLAFQSRTKKVAADLTKLGLVGLDGRYLNNAPQCTGWMDLARDGGSGSLYILWSGIYKLNTAAAIPYYSGQYAPEKRGNRIGFGFVAIGAGIDDFSRPADEMGERLTDMVSKNLGTTYKSLVMTTLVLSVIVVFIAIWMASYLSNRLQWLINGITKFRYGDRYFRFGTNRYDEFGRLARSFDDMADSIVLSVHSPLVITDMELKIIYANAQSLDVIGKCDIQDVVGKSYEFLSVYPFGTEYCPITTLLRGSGSASVYYDERTGLFLQGNASYITDERGKQVGYIITSVDVTELSRKQLQLEKANAAMELANSHKSDFLSRMSHELRTPMNAILGINNIAQSKIREFSNRAEFTDLNAHLTQLQTSSTHLLRMLNDILDISNLETGSIELFDMPIDLNVMLNEIEGVMRLNCKSKGLGLSVDIEEFSPPNFVADGLRLRQALNNLLNNAVKYTPEGGKIELAVKRKAQRGGKALLLFTVRDNGIGISEDAIEKIFRPFEQGNDDIRKLYGGSGLGLAITQQILKLFHSEIHVESKLGKGSEFRFEVWLTEDENAAERSSAIEVKGHFKGQRALIIDDVRLNRMVLASLLKEAGFIADEAIDGSEGLKMFADSPEKFYDVIFMDIQMPIMDGYIATESIRALEREDAKKIPIVAISANSFKEDIDKSIASGMDAHHAKPITMETLTQILMEYCKPTGR
ncbi:MAG: response regulator, partial [Planctomycetaceae bacterium]|nr:response regulator [Planctomycetaceae bacterium]